MHFQMKYNLDVDLVPGQTIEFSEQVPHRMEVVFYRPALQGAANAAGTNCLATVQLEEPVAQEIRKQFENVEDLHPTVLAIHARIRSRADECLVRAIRVLRWRRGYVEDGNPLRSAGLLGWSDDGHIWNVVSDPPGSLGLQPGIPFLKLSDDVLASYTELMRSGTREPIARELFREAWALRRNSPRSALLMGIAAAEVGFKAFISELVPDAEWLAFNAPTPPLNKMLATYLPTLPVKLKFEDSAFVPTPLRRVLSDGAELRNKIAHAGSSAPSREDLERILKAVNDLLYLLDGYSGHEWAVQCVSHDTRELIRSELRNQK
jgi:hypothetical protein